jgi:hypothetical protein
LGQGTTLFLAKRDSARVFWSETHRKSRSFHFELGGLHHVMVKLPARTFMRCPDEIYISNALTASVKPLHPHSISF